MQLFSLSEQYWVVPLFVNDIDLLTPLNCFALRRWPGSGCIRNTIFKLKGKSRSNLEPKIYVACLAAYNNGILYGKWIDAAQGVDAIQDEINEMLASSPIPNAEEFTIHDYEGFGSVELKEYSGLESVSEMAFFIKKHGELGAELLSYNYNNVEEAEQ